MYRLLVLLAIAGVGFLLSGVPSQVAAQARVGVALAWLNNLKERSPNPRVEEVVLWNINEAYRLDPASVETRLMLFRMVLAVDGKYPGSVTRAAIEEAYRISQSASPAHAALLKARIAYLHSLGECGPVAFSEECAATIRLLFNTASRRQGINTMLEGTR